MNGGTTVDAGGTGAGRRPFARLAIVNRGEPAMRLINAVREWNAEGRSPLRTIALYTAADRRAMFVREADEAVLIGPATDGGADASNLAAPNPYLDPILSPSARVTSGGGPTNTTPRSRHSCAKSAFSLTKPQPGHTASARQARRARASSGRSR